MGLLGVEELSQDFLTFLLLSAQTVNQGRLQRDLPGRNVLGISFKVRIVIGNVHRKVQATTVTGGLRQRRRRHPNPYKVTIPHFIHTLLTQRAFFNQGNVTFCL